MCCKSPKNYSTSGLMGRLKNILPSPLTVYEMMENFMAQANPKWNIILVGMNVCKRSKCGRTELVFMMHLKESPKWSQTPRKGSWEFMIGGRKRLCDGQQDSKKTQHNSCTWQKGMLVGKILFGELLALKKIQPKAWVTVRFLLRDSHILVYNSKDFC